MPLIRSRVFIRIFHLISIEIVCKIMQQTKEVIIRFNQSFAIIHFDRTFLVKQNKLEFLGQIVQSMMKVHLRNL